MKRVRALTLIFCAAAACTAGGSGWWAGGRGHAADHLVEVKVCPMQGEPVHDPHAESEVVGRYKVYFCCPPCREPFDKLGAEERARRIDAALKKQDGDGQGRDGGEVRH